MGSTISILIDEPLSISVLGTYETTENLFLTIPSPISEVPTYHLHTNPSWTINPRIGVIEIGLKPGLIFELYEVIKTYRVTLGTTYLGKIKILNKGEMNDFIRVAVMNENFNDGSWEKVTLTEPYDINLIGLEVTLGLFSFFSCKKKTFYDKIEFSDKDELEPLSCIKRCN